MYGAGQESGLRLGTENVPYVVALGKACEIAKRDFCKNTGTMRLTRDKLLNGLKSNLAGRVFENVDLKNCLPNTLSVSFAEAEAHTLVSVLSNSVLISAGSTCHADSIEISPVLKSMQVESMKAAGTVRISIGKQTTDKEIEKAIHTISETVNKLSN